MIKNLLAPLEGKKTYLTVVTTILVCAALYVAGADAPTLAMVGISGLLGGTASLRDAVSRGTVTKEELAAEVVKQALMDDEPAADAPENP